MYVICGDSFLSYNEIVGGVLVSLRLLVCPSIPGPVSALYRLQFWLDPFHIYTSYIDKMYKYEMDPNRTVIKTLNFWPFF